MTANTKMTEQEARNTIDSFPPEFNALALPGYYHKAVGFLEGLQAGLSAGRAEMAEEAAEFCRKSVRINRKTEPFFVECDLNPFQLAEGIERLAQRDGGTKK